MNSNSNSSKKGGPDIFTSIITNFPCELCPKIFIDNDNVIYMISVRHGFTLNVTIFIILPTNIYVQACNEPWYCHCGTNTLFAFGNLNNENFLAFISSNSNEKFKKFSDSQTTPRFST